MNFKHGFFNRYSFGVFLVLLALFLLGIVLLISGSLVTVLYSIPIGIITIPPGILLVVITMTLFVRGLKTPDPSPTKAWIITWWGAKTDVVVTSWPVLLFDFPIDIVGKVEIVIEKTDHDFPMRKDIYCGGDQSYVNGKISVSFIPDKTSGETLSAFDDAGRVKGIIAQLDEMLTTAAEEVAVDKSGEWMETHAIEITEYILNRIEGKDGRGPSVNDNHTFDDTRGLGIKIEKLQPVLVANETIRNARNDKKVEEAQRRAELADTETINKQVEERFRYYGGTVSRKDCRKEIFDERLDKHGKYTKIVNEGGVNLTNVDSNKNTNQ